MVAENLEPEIPLKSPYPYFGGKSRIAPLIWQAFGNPANFVEPFFGSGAALLARKNWQGKIETINELNPYVANFWRALRADPEQTAYYADYPVNECDLHARHLWLVNQGDFREKMLTDPDYFDPKIAGWWCWGISQWIGHGWCSLEHLKVDGTPWKRPLALSSGGQGINRTTVARKIPQMKGTGGEPHQSLNDDAQTPTRQLPKFPPGGVHRQGLADEPISTVTNKRPFLMHEGRGVQRKSLDNTPTRQMRHLSGGGQGINRPSQQLPFVGNAGRGDASPSRREALYQYFEDLAARLRNVRVTCGDFARVLGPSVTEIGSTNAIFLDPPYITNEEIYGIEKTSPAARALEWCKANWHKPNLRIALCGYEGEFDIPSDWRVIEWKGVKGYADNEKNKNRERERIWLSPACLKIEERKQLSLWGNEEAI
jgi:hypothetical protein